MTERERVRHHTPLPKMDQASSITITKGNDNCLVTRLCMDWLLTLVLRL